jgi:hypothetical protein
MPARIEVSILPHQLQFLQSTKRYVALCGGFGCGKSWALCMKAWQLASVNAGFDGMLISRYSKQLHDFLMPEMVRTLTMVNAPWSMRDGNKLILDWGHCRSVIHLLTTENDAYARWAGGNMAWACIDEIDTMQKPAEAWSYPGRRPPFYPDASGFEGPLAHRLRLVVLPCRWIESVFSVAALRGAVPQSSSDAASKLCEETQARHGFRGAQAARFPT